MFDFHSHVLPGIDDGSACVEESIALLHMEAEQGITHLVATPHFYPRYDKPQEFLARRSRAEEKLRNKMSQYTGLPELYVGAEVYYFHGMSNSDFLPQLTVADKNYIMVEMPASPWRDSVYQELEQIYRRWGIVPIIAHVDRYIAPFRTFDIPAQLEQRKVLVQANADFFLRKSTAWMAMRMLRKDQIQLLGSDCHNLKHRKPNMQAAAEIIKKRNGAELLARVDECAREVLGL